MQHGTAQRTGLVAQRDPHGSISAQGSIWVKRQRWGTSKRYRRGWEKRLRGSAWRMPRPELGTDGQADGVTGTARIAGDAAALSHPSATRAFSVRYCRSASPDPVHGEFVKLRRDRH